MCCGCFDDVVGDGVEVVDFEDALDLGKESLEEPEVAACDAFDGGGGLGVGEVVRVELLTEAGPLAVEDEYELVVS